MSDMTIRHEFAEAFGLGGAIYLDAISMILRSRCGRGQDTPGKPLWVWLTDADLHRGCLSFLSVDQIRVARERLTSMGALIEGTKDEAIKDGTPMEGDPPARALWFRLADEALFLSICRIHRSAQNSNPVNIPDCQSGKFPDSKREKSRIAPISRSPSETPSVMPSAKAPALGRKQRQSAGEPTAGTHVWDAYAEAYAKRYGRAPVRNAKQNALCTQIAERLGHDAPRVASFFVTHGSRFYVQALHPLSLLVRDAEAMATQASAGHQVTETLAKKLDQHAESDAMLARASSRYADKYGTQEIEE